MRVGRLLPLFLCLFSLASFAQKEDWLPVTQQDLQYKDVPGNKGAPAVKSSASMVGTVARPSRLCRP